MRLNAFQQAYALFLRQNGKLSLRRIAAMSNMSKSSVHRICQKGSNLCGLSNADVEVAQSHKHRRKPGPKLKLSARDKRVLLRTLHIMRKNKRHITVMSLVKEAGLDPTLLHRRTYTKYLNAMGFKFLEARKKGLLSDKDKKIRFQYASAMKKTLRDCPDFYKNQISFYLDGVSFIHKFNPMKDVCQTKSRVWRKRGEGFQLTSRGSKELAGGRRLHLMVAIAHGKGIILKDAYEKMSGHFFSSFIPTRFNITFAKAGPKANGGRYFIMDNDPCQTSRKSISALNDMEAELHRIPPRSPDLNPIENTFHLIKKKLADEALKLKIEKESFEQFKSCVFRCCDNIDSSIIDRTIESLPKRINAS
jgi:predicted DNA-binding protein YlxM (UPF0122 family)